MRLTPIALAVALGTAIASFASAQQLPAQVGAAPASPPSTAADGQRGYGPMHGLLTPEEWRAFHDRMRSAQSYEERRQVRDSMHALMEQRAQEKGVTLPQRGAGMGYGMDGPAGRPGPGGGWGRAYDQLFSQDERDAFRAKMQAAQTREERARLWADQRALAEERAKEKGMTLPPNRGPGGGPGYAHGGAPGNGRGGLYRELFTEQERDAFRAKMHAAQTPEERARLWSDQRTLAEQRAKEKGITLPADRGPGGGPGYGPGGGPGLGRGGVYRELFSEQERDAFRARMQAAQTPEERARLWSEQRALAEQRAKEKGVTPHANHGQGAGLGRGYGAAYSRPLASGSPCAAGPTSGPPASTPTTPAN